MSSPPPVGATTRRTTANALRFHATANGKTLALPDLSAFGGKRVEVIVVVAEARAETTAAPRKPVRPFGTMAGEILVAASGTELPIASAHAIAAAALPFLHGDPFDRMPLPQGAIETLVQVTADGAVRQCDTSTQWAIRPNDGPSPTPRADCRCRR